MLESGEQICLGLRSQPVALAALADCFLFVEAAGEGMGLVGRDAEFLGDLGYFRPRALLKGGEELLAALAEGGATFSFREISIVDCLNRPHRNAVETIA